MGHHISRPLRHCVIVLGLVGLAMATSTACGAGGTEGGGESAKPFHLRIDSASLDEPVKLFAKEGEETTIQDRYVDDLTISVTTVSGESAEITTSQPMAPAGKTGGKNLNDLQTRFTVAKHEPVTFSTPTMDGGTKYTVTYEDISVE